VAAVTVLAGAGVAATVVAPSAEAFDCKTASKCPFVKIEIADHGLWASYDASADLADAGGATLHQWSERHPEFTLWHWRYSGGGGQVRIHVHSWSTRAGDTFSADNEFTTPADTSMCIKVDEVGAFQSGGCTDYEDPARSNDPGHAPR
jgi:hypothetical protein